MPIEKDVAKDYEPKNLLEDDSETSGDSSTEKTEDQTEESTSAGDEKTEGSEEGDAKAEGQPVAYERFKEVNEAKKAALAEKERIAEELDALKNDPELLEIYLKKQKVTSQDTKNYDFKTQEGWQKFIEDKVQEAVNPLRQTLTQKERLESYSGSLERAKKLSKSYGIEFGDDAKDDETSDTACGKIQKYMKIHPEITGEAVLALGVDRILTLAMGENLDFVKAKGKEEELKRQKALKESAMEDGQQTVKKGLPNSDWSEREILDFARKNPDYVDKTLNV